MRTTGAQYIVRNMGCHSVRHSRVFTHNHNSNINILYLLSLTTYYLLLIPQPALPTAPPSTIAVARVHMLYPSCTSTLPCGNPFNTKQLVLCAEKRIYYNRYKGAKGKNHDFPFWGFPNPAHPAYQSPITNHQPPAVCLSEYLSQNQAKYRYTSTTYGSNSYQYQLLSLSRA
jgi:hypothetical protein